MKKINKLFTTGVIAGLSAAAGAVVYTINKNKKVFSREKWNVDVENRFRMSDSLIREGEIIGMDRQEVIDFLGINGLKSNTKDTMEYYLSAEDIEQPKILIIDFDEDNKVINCTACV
ncbi:MAG: hypothetical protein IJC74_01400 [Clostridia bacterium]|nr:hypothetical protein [Clostridia bacterium]